MFTTEHNISHAEISSEAMLIRLALDLGAAEVGGPLSDGERTLVAAVAEVAPMPFHAIEQVRAAIRNGGDPLGIAFCRLRSPAQRRASGAFYTPPTLVEPMVAWVLEQAPTRVVDAGCGSGRFAAAIVRRAPSTLVVAVDIDPLATLTTRAALAVLGACRVEVRQADFTRLTLPPIDGRTAYLGNPPYVRHHDIAPEAKAWSVATAARLGQTASTFALAGLHAHFYVAVASQAAPGDIGCFVTSSEWLDVGYGAVVRGLLLDGLGAKAIHVVAPVAVPFEDAMTTAAICCFEIGAHPAMVLLNLVDTPTESLTLNVGTTCPRDTLARASKWTPLLSRQFVAAQADDAVPLGAIARVHRGLVTGANEYFVVTREDAARLGIERWCRPAITSGREIMNSDGVIRDGPERRRLVVFPPDIDRSAFPMVDAYLRVGEQLGIPERYIASHRRPWWHLASGAPPPMVVSYMARQAPRFAANPDGLTPINVAHGLYPHQPLTNEEIIALVGALNSVRERFRGAGRTYHGGMEKFEPKEAEALQVPVALLPDRLRPLI